MHGFTLLLHKRLESLRKVFQHGRLTYPKTAAALCVLQTAIDEEAALGIRQGKTASNKRRRQQCQPQAAASSRKHYFRAVRLQARLKILQTDYDLVMKTKEDGNVTSQECILRVILAAPALSARGFAQSFRDVVGCDGNTVSRLTIGKIKDAWVEMYKRMVLAVGAKHVALAFSASKRHREEFVAVFLQHVQDEAYIKLRSGDLLDVFSVKFRRRASKVQLNVVQQSTTFTDLDAPHRVGSTRGHDGQSFGDLLRAPSAAHR